MDKKPSKPPAKNAAPKPKAPVSRVSPASVPRDNNGTKKAASKKPAPKAPATPAKRAPAKKAAAKAPSPALADTKPKAHPKSGAVPRVGSRLKPAAKASSSQSPTKASTTEAPQLGLTPKQQRFVEEYMVDLNGAQAAIRAGYSVATAKQIATENLSKPYLQAAIAEERRKQSERTGMTADALLAQAWAIATADPRELMELKVGCCRYCWGIGHMQQRTVAEMNKALEAFHANKKKPKDVEFDEQGGIGFDANRPPHPECPECYGDGHPREVIHDTRNLSPAAAQLYAGLKRTKEGLQVLTHSREAFAEKLWKHFGLYEKDNLQKGDALTSLLGRLTTENGNGIKPVAVDPEHPSNQAQSRLTPRQDPDGDK